MAAPPDPKSLRKFLEDPSILRLAGRLRGDGIRLRFPFAIVNLLNALIGLAGTVGFVAILSATAGWVPGIPPETKLPALPIQTICGLAALASFSGFLFNAFRRLAYDVDSESLTVTLSVLGVVLKKRTVPLSAVTAIRVSQKIARDVQKFPSVYHVLTIETGDQTVDRTSTKNQSSMVRAMEQTRDALLAAVRFFGHPL